MNRVQEEIAAGRLARMVGTTRRALLESAEDGFLEARLPENIVVRVEGNASLVGKHATVTVTSAKSWIAEGCIDSIEE